MKQYVEQRSEGYWITDKRISLDSIVYAFRRGQSPESIRRSFPLLTLEEIYGAIAFYLANQKEIDAYLSKEEAEFEEMRQNYAEIEFDLKRLDELELLEMVEISRQDVAEGNILSHDEVKKRLNFPNKK